MAGFEPAAFPVAGVFQYRNDSDVEMSASAVPTPDGRRVHCFANDTLFLYDVRGSQSTFIPANATPLAGSRTLGLVTSLVRTRLPGYSAYQRRRPHWNCDSGD